MIHEVKPRPGTIRSGNPASAGRQTTGLNPDLYPLNALCATCGLPIRKREINEAWFHKRQAKT